VQPFGLNPRSALRFLRAWRKSLSLCDDLFSGESPAVVVGCGGFGSGPALKAALNRGIPTALLNPDAIPGRANRHFGKRVDAIYAQWDGAAACFPPSANVLATGCPVRKEFCNPKSVTDYTPFGLDPTLKTLLVTGASSGARTINEAVLELAQDLAQLDGWQVLHISGERDAKQLAETYEASRVKAAVVPFTHEMAAALRLADLALARAGAVTLAELAATATPALLLPYPFHRDDHQTANAEMLVRQGSAIRLVDLKSAAANAVQLRAELLPLMRGPDLLHRMATRADQSGTGQAAETISEHLLKLAQIAAE
jgi:UDP-N-acetylglucosamine--N-acetylmuramyl-(pentapeptide) pyrophosphoryl-undecaprenol N-acetylglucosamine transferase